jgi:hypothetical protein
MKKKIIIIIIIIRNGAKTISLQTLFGRFNKEGSLRITHATIMLSWVSIDIVIKD